MSQDLSGPNERSPFKKQLSNFESKAFTAQPTLPYKADSNLLDNNILQADEKKRRASACKEWQAGAKQMLLFIVHSIVSWHRITLQHHSELLTIYT